MQVILNIGLDGVPPSGLGYTNGERNPSIADKVFTCLRELRARGFVNPLGRLVQSASEPTLVVETRYDGPGLDNAITMLAVALKQEAIAAYICEEFRGDLYGPACAKWGPFNPEYFFMRSGRTLQQVQYASERMLQGAGA